MVRQYPFELATRITCNADNGGRINMHCYAYLYSRAWRQSTPNPKLGSGSGTYFHKLEKSENRCQTSLTPNFGVNRDQLCFKVGDPRSRSPIGITSTLPRGSRLLTNSLALPT